MMDDAKEKTILQVKNLVTSFETESGRVRAIDRVSFNVEEGSIIGIVGESGCGKSVTALSIMRLLPKPAGRIDGGEVIFENRDLTALSPDLMHGIRGRKISMIFQEPMTALNPVHRIGKQIEEVFHLHFQGMAKDEKRQQAVKILRKVGIPEPEHRFSEYPHQISGGMRQRVMIAMALACRPRILIADEPTTALDVTIQAQILDLMKNLQKETGMSVVFITHDLGVIAELCDKVVVMYAGRIAEKADAAVLFNNPAHPYTRGLLASMPRLVSKRKTRLKVIRGMVPGLEELPDGCRFYNRCSRKMDHCRESEPKIKEISPNHFVGCFLYE